MKKVFISFLIMTFMLTPISLVNISSVQAATNDAAVTTTDSTIKISLDNIRDIVIENNLNIKSQDNTLKIAKEKRDDAKTTYDGKTKPTKEEYTDSITGYDSTGYNDALTAYNNAQTAYETANDNYKTAKKNYDQNVETVVYSAQGAFLTYLADLATEKINEDTGNYNDKKAQIYKVQYENGFISKNQYIGNLQANTSANDLNSSKNKVELERIKLCDTLGISSEEKVIFDTELDEDFQVISKINYEDDLNKMLDNNLDIKDKNDAIDDLEDEEDTTYKDQEDIYDYKHDNVEIDLKQSINTAETDFKGKYNDLMTSYNSVKSSYDKIIQEQNGFKTNEVQYDYGFISKNALDNAKITLDKDNASFIKSRNDCYLLYLKYIEMKEGY